MSRVVELPEAIDDVNGIALYLGERNLSVGQRFIQATKRAYSLLGEMPLLGGACESDRPELVGTRLWTIRGFRKYVILYKPIPDGIEVIRVFHGSRDLEGMFESTE